ncbi:hypothetical protein COCON_G00100350 [Conger conger]|uniref:Histone PARylation factor 1 n=1 Tax=Conger conger TaxID=82655 RepID=A0A9Q1DHR0_CONCO|nr:histone PARylation factor 1 [Conger conger]KAJ8271176.1 hypothetical protein COCON_G00100350 [Conger conger]
MAGRGKRRAKSALQEAETANGKLRKAVPVKECQVPEALRWELLCLYRLPMPEDFYHFWSFCTRLDAQNPCDALRETLGLRLVGPFEIMAEKHRSAKNPNYFLHWRHFYDPPEFQTILIGSRETQHHMGYYRDAPDSLPVFVGENEALKSCSITQMGDNIFAAVLLFLLKKKKEVGGRQGAGPLQAMEAELRSAAEALGVSLEQKSKAMKQRDRKVVAKTFHGAGIVVPVDRNDVGYRELPETDASLRRLCRAIAEARDDEERVKAFGPLQEIITFVQFANDECDYGMGYELGLDLFCYGSPYLYKVVRQLLPLAYSLLKRDLFGQILEAHLSNRSQEPLDQLCP